MISQEDLAAAIVAKLTSSELRTVDGYTEKQSSTGQANRLDPMSFVPQVKQQQDLNAKVREQEMIERLNREAEMQFPLPPPVQFVEPVSQQTALQAGSPANWDLTEITTCLSAINTTLIDIKKSLDALNLQK